MLCLKNTFCPLGVCDVLQVWGPGLICFDCVWILMGSFLVTSRLSSSVIVKLFSAQETFWKVTKGTE